jgi:hypothetical protein
METGCAVGNYGQGGYGTDQAFLRYRHNDADRATVVILGLLTENVVRHLTRDRDLLTYSMAFAYKPRFVVEEGELVLVPLPCLTEDEHLRLVGLKSPQLELEYESFFPGGPAGMYLPGFPYTYSLARGLGDYRFRARLVGRPTHAEYFERGHPLQGYEITRGICLEFAKLARSRKQYPLVLVLPTRQDVESWRKDHQWCYDELVADLRSAGVDTIEFGSALAESLEGRDVREAYDYSDHFEPAANRRLAEFVHGHLRTLLVYGELRRRPGRR